MNKFKRYKCDTCNKETDIDNNLTHAFIDRCNLTVGCLGTLRLIGEKNTKDNILNIASLPQQQQIGARKIESILPEYINAASSDDNHVCIAVKHNGVQLNPNSELTLNLLEILNKEQEFKEFVFNLTVPVSAISGKDHSISQKVLSFNEEDSITIFINGQKIDDESFVADSNIIRFNQQITYNSFGSSSIFVKILVFAKEESTVKTLTFKKNVAGTNATSWSNVNEADFLGETFSVFTCESLEGLNLNSRLTIDSAKIDNQTIALENLHLLLAQEPFSVFDRLQTKTIRLDSLDGTSQHLKYQAISKNPKILVTSISINDVYPIIKPAKYFDETIEIKATSTISKDTAINSTINSNNKFVLGPV